MLLNNCRINAKRLQGGRNRLSTTKTVSRRKFNVVSEERIEQLKQQKLKKSCEAKLDWAVTAYCDWRNDRLQRFQYDPAIYFADILDLENLQKDNLNHSLCRFIPEVTKKEVKVRTLVQLCIK